MCFAPVTFRNKKSREMQTIPCGKCLICRQRRAAGWTFRLMQEEKVSTSAWFITFTYADESIPVSPNRRRTLCKRDLQLFFKRLRKTHEGNGGTNLKYYAVGEYGGRTKRPHYHAIIFNVDVELVEKAWNCKHIRQRFKGTGFTSVSASELAGECYFGTVTDLSVGYTLKYMCKEPWRPSGKNDDRQPPFSLMSKGLGISYVENPKVFFYHQAFVAERCFCVLPGDIKIAMPRYYKLKMFTESQRKRIATYFEQVAAEKVEVNVQTLREKSEAHFASNERMRMDNFATL